MPRAKPRVSQPEPVARLEAIALAERRIFADDWIGALTDAEQVLLEKYGPTLKFREGVRPGTPPVLIIDRCPTRAIASKLDRALGRRERLLAQRATAEEWLKTNGPPFEFGVCDPDALKAALAKLDPVVPVTTRGPGQPETVGPRVKREMRADLENGLDHAKFAAMTGKELKAKYGCGETLARKMRREVLADELASAGK
jgi:hypothetical protein